MRVPPPGNHAAQTTTGRAIAQPVPPSAEQPAQTADSISHCILAYYYAALTNLFCQSHLSPEERVADDDMVRAVADKSYADFRKLDGLLEDLDKEEIQLNPNWQLYHEARENWRRLVKDWAMIAKTDQQKPTET